MRRCFVGLSVTALLAGAGAQAQEAIPTASGGGAPPGAQASGVAPTWISNEASDRDDRGPVPVGPCGSPYKQTQDGQFKQDKNPHGAVWAGVGTHGYREAGGALCVPLGQNGQVSIAVDDSRWGRR